MKFSNTVKKSLAGAIVALGTAGAAAATEHTILVMPDAYFPDITHVNVGDTVIFVNTTTEPHNIVAASEAWSIGPVPVEGQAELVILENQETDFFNADAVNELGEFIVTGHLSFEAAPID